MPPKPNGSSKALMAILTALVVLGVGSGLGFGISEARTAQRDLREHQLGPGHATMIERTERMREDIAEIKAILRRIEGKMKGR